MNAPEFVIWDHKELPDWDEINRQQLQSAARLFCYPVENTYQDCEAVLLSPVQGLSAERVQTEWDRYVDELGK
jgi:hypothetical protein